MCPVRNVTYVTGRSPQKTSCLQNGYRKAVSALVDAEHARAPAFPIGEVAIYQQRVCRFWQCCRDCGMSNRPCAVDCASSVIPISISAGLDSKAHILKNRFSIGEIATLRHL
jgi:hypothetical protein